MLAFFQVIVQEGGMKRDLVVGVVRARHDVHKAAGEVRHTVGYHACNGNVVYCDASDKQHLFEGRDFLSNFKRMIHGSTLFNFC